MLTTGKLAQAGGVGVETACFYQRRNLIGTPPRDHGLRRYGPEDIRRLRFIRKAQQAGFTLEEIRELIALDSGHDHRRARDIADIRLAKLGAQIADLQRARQSLQKLATEWSAEKSKPCPILAAFGV